MKALKCDVCGGYFDGIKTISGMPENKKPNKLQIYYEAHSGQMKDDVEVDICPDCYEAIKTTLNNRRSITIVCSDRSEDDLK